MFICNAVAPFCWLQIRRKVIALSKISILGKYLWKLKKNHENHKRWFRLKKWWMVQAQLLRCMDGPSQWTYIFRWRKYSFSFLMLSFWGSFQGLVEVVLHFYRFLRCWMSYRYYVFFLKHAWELHIIILRKAKGEKIPCTANITT
jgi:hypothetical protein